jgi:hypothetical protein
MLVKGILVLIGGFLFVFASGLPMRLISRFKPNYKREGMYWGMGIYIITFLLGAFIQNLILQIVSGGSSRQEGAILPFLLGTVFTTLLLLLGMRLFLKFKQAKGDDLQSVGLALGFGVGMIAQVFTGMILITAGAGLIFRGIGFDFTLNNLQAPMLEALLGESIFGILAGLIALILYRMALLIVGAGQGLLTAFSITGKKSWFWAAALIGLLFPWVILFIQSIAGVQNPGSVSLGVTPPIQSVLISLYYLAIFFFGYRWIHNELYQESNKSKKGNKK